MIKWILDNAEMNNRQFKIQGHGLIGSFAAQDLRLMYHLPESQVNYNAQFIKKFAVENPNLSETTKDWSRKEEPLKKNKNGMYSTGSLTSPYCFAAAMLCRLFGMPDINKFLSEWLPLIDAATNVDIINYRSKRSLSQRIYPPFYLSTYAMDSICYVSKFPIMGWKWTTQDPLPIHVYDKILWDSQFIPHFYQICHGLILPLYKMLYDEDPLRCSPEAQIDIIPIARWFGEEWFTYVRVFRSTVPLVEKQVTDYLTWQNGDEGKRAGAPRINENHKELLFNKWDDQIIEAEKATEMATTTASILIDSVNENLHRANLIAETTLGYLPNKQRLEAEWRQKPQEKGKEIQALNRLNWECYWAYLVKPHSQWMTVKCIVNVAEKVVPALIDSIFSAQLKAKVGQPTLLKPMMNTCSFKDQIQK